MELIKNKERGRPDLNTKYKDQCFLSIRKTRGTFTEETVRFLDIPDEGKMIAFFRHRGKHYISLEQKNNSKGYLKVSRINKRMGVYTGGLVDSGEFESGEYIICKEPVVKNDKEWFLLIKV